MFGSLIIDKHHAAVIDNGVIYTYNDLDEYSRQITDNIKARSLVLFICDNSYDALAAYYGFINKKIVVLLIKPLSDLQTIIKAYNPNFIFCPAKMKLNTHLLRCFGSYCLYQFNDKSIKMYDELAILLSTSGSTGSPRCVRLSYSNLLCNTKQIIEALGITKNDRVITTLPFYYTYGLSIINTHLYQGATIIANRFSVMSKKFWEEVREQEVTTFGGVPFTYEYIYKSGVNLQDFPSIKYLTQAGGKLDSNVTNYLLEEAIGVPFIKMYGQVEATARITVTPREFIKEKRESVGVAVKKGKIKIVAENGTVVEEANKIGEIFYQGPNVMLGYASRLEDLKKGNECQGSIMTGDIGYLDKDDFLYILGRKSRFIKVCGERISLDEIEAGLKILGCICACKGEDNKIMVYLESGEIDRVTQYMVNKLKIQRMYFNVNLVSCLPRNEAGKIMYSSL